MLKLLTDGQEYSFASIHPADMKNNKAETLKLMQTFINRCLHRMTNLKQSNKTNNNRLLESTSFQLRKKSRRENRGGLETPGSETLKQKLGGWVTPEMISWR